MKSAPHIALDHALARHLFWCARLFTFAAWAILIVVWRRAGHFGFSVDALSEELPFISLFVLLPGAILLLGAPLLRYTLSYLCVVLLAAGVAEGVASSQEYAFVARCLATSGSKVIEQPRFGIISGPRMLFLRSLDGHEAFHGYD